MDIITILQAIVLGIVEGLTEFIPVSSTGHLILLIDIIGFKSPPGKTFEIIIQLGAIFAVCWLYRKKILGIVLSLHNKKESQRFALMIILAFLPSMVLGAALHGFIKSVLFAPIVVAVALVVGGIIILIVEKNLRAPKFNDVDNLPLKTAFFIGCCQTLAMIPGTSRSGATIIGSLLLGVDRRAATEFSFFLAIPTMLAATVFDVYKNYHEFSSDGWVLIAAGFLAAFFSALLVVKTLINFVSTHGFKHFAYYRIVLGLLMMWLLL